MACLSGHNFFVYYHVCALVFKFGTVITPHAYKDNLSILRKLPFAFAVVKSLNLIEYSVLLHHNKLVNYSSDDFMYTVY